MTRRVACRFLVSPTNSRNVICPLRPKVLKNLKVVKMGKNITCVFFTTTKTTLDNFFPEPCEEPHLLFYVVPCCLCCRFLPSVPSHARKPFCCLLLFLLSFSPFLSEPARKLVVVPSCYLLSFYSFRNYFYAIFSKAFVSSYFFISSSRFSRQTNEPPFFMRLTICCSFSLSCDLPFSALRSIGLDTILNIIL